MASFKDKMRNKKTVGNKIINESASEAVGLVFNDSNKKVIDIQISALNPNPYQPRFNINQEDLNDLASSIQLSGQLQPIIVSPINNNPHQFYIVAGHRRVEALKLLKKEFVSAISYQTTEEDLKIYSIVENIQRENLTAIEEAFAIKSLIDTGMKQIEVSKRLGKSTTTISRLVKISSLDQTLIKHLQENDKKVSVKVLEEISRLDLGLQMKVFKYIRKNSLNIEEIRKYINIIHEDKIPIKKKVFSGFSCNQNKNKINLKIDMDIIKDKKEAIQTLEKILIDLRSKDI